MRWADRPAIEALTFRNLAGLGQTLADRYCEVVRRQFPVSLSKSSGRLIAGLMTPALLAGCGGSGNLISTVALPTRQSPDFSDGMGVDGARPQIVTQGGLRLTESQRAYLDDLAAAGIRPSSDLRALSIGSYICQARAAGQSDQAVRDYVAPMVRSDLADSHAAAPRTPAGVAADAAIAEYIRSATQRLC